MITYQLFAGEKKFSNSRSGPNTLVFGGNGFIGKDVVDVLRTYGKNVMNADITRIDNGVPFVRCDITDKDSVRNAAKATVQKFGGIDNIALISGLFDYNAPEELLYMVNAQGAANVADVALEVGEEQHLSPCLVYLGAAASYGLDLNRPISEMDPDEPLGPYGASKLEGEKKILKKCQESYKSGYENSGLKAISLRCAMVYGRNTEGTMIDGYVQMAKDMPFLLGTPMKNSWIHTVDIGIAINRLFETRMDPISNSSPHGWYQCRRLSDIIVNLADDEINKNDLETLEQMSKAAGKRKKGIAPDMSGVMKFLAKVSKGKIVAEEFAAHAGIDHVLSNEKSKQYDIPFRFMDRKEGFEDVMSQK